MQIQMFQIGKAERKIHLFDALAGARQILLATIAAAIIALCSIVVPSALAAQTQPLIGNHPTVNVANMSARADAARPLNATYYRSRRGILRRSRNCSPISRIRRHRATIIGFRRLSSMPGSAVAPMKSLPSVNGSRGRACAVHRVLAARPHNHRDGRSGGVRLRHADDRVHRRIALCQRQRSGRFRRNLRT